jgi:hypothetical protein
MDIGRIYAFCGRNRMDDYRVTYSNGETAIISAWTPELAQAVAEEEAEERGFAGSAVVCVELLEPQEVQP